MSTNNRVNTSSYDFVINRNLDDDQYSVWKVSIGSGDFLTKLNVAADATFDKSRSLAAIGDYLLDWSVLHKDDQTFDPTGTYDYRLSRLDPGSDDPLGAASTVLTGTWAKSKFWGRRADFGNPKGDKTPLTEQTELFLVPLPNFMLNMIPTAGRGTFRLWDFDPQPLPQHMMPDKTNNPDDNKSPLYADPLPQAQSPQGAFETIQRGHELISIGNFVLDWEPKTSKYWVWSFDPGAHIPLSRPTLQRGTWTSIDETHRLVAIGEHVLDWCPADGSYRVWKFDHNSEDPLTGPVDSGTLPDGFTPNSVLTAVQPRRPAVTSTTAQPGTLDFMRSRVKHVVYYMLENRSFDHVCGWLYENDPESINFIGDSRPFDGASTDMFNIGADGKPVYLSKYEDGRAPGDFNLAALEQDPYHDISDVMRQLFYEDLDGYTDQSPPNMGGFVWNNGTNEVMRTFSPEQLPVLAGLAKAFGVSDEWFCSMPTGTTVNRAISLTGSALKELNNFQNGSDYEYWPKSSHRPSIWKTLWSNGISDWKMFHSIEWLNFVYSYQLFLQGQIPAVDANVAPYLKAWPDDNKSPDQKATSKYLGSITQFLEQAKSGELPAFSFIEPIWIANEGTTSYHQGGDLVPGEVALNEIYDALRSGPNWDDTVLVITFDEHGGIYDHVAPPRAANPWPNDVEDGFKYDLMGPRVPTIVVSPLVKENTVFRAGGATPYDSTSILATVLDWFGVPQARWGLGERTQQAPTFEDVFQLATPRQPVPTFENPTDKSNPGTAAEPAERRLDDLIELMVPHMVQQMSAGKHTDAEALNIAHAMLSEANDQNSLHDLLKELGEKLAT